MQFIKNSSEGSKSAQLSMKRVMNDMNDPRLIQLDDNTCRFQIEFQQQMIMSLYPLIGSFKNNLYQFSLDFKTNYPYYPPSISVISLIPHPNIDLKTQQLYLRFIDSINWKPIYGVFDIANAIKQTIIHIDYTYIPNQLSCIKSAQRMGQQDHSTDEEELEDNGFEISQNFIHNFELPQNSRISMENEQSEGTDEESKEISLTEQEPAIINLTKSTKHFIDDQNTLPKVKK